MLQHVRRTLAESQEALICVAFMHERGLHLLEDELERAAAGPNTLRVLVTTTFATTGSAALARADHLGAKVRVLNPGSGSYHPKVYLGTRPGEIQAVIGSANLTAGLATNVEVGVWMRGAPAEPPLARVRAIAESLWSDPRARAWQATSTAEPRASVEIFAEDLHAAIVGAARESPVFMTLGATPRPNRIVDVTRDGLFIETERSLVRRGAPEHVPAWKFNLAWDYLHTHGSISNTVLLHDLRVHRSSAVCAILARVPGVERVPGDKILLRWRPPGTRPSA